MVYSLKLEIPLNQLEWLTDNKYKVCIAKKINEDYNTIWESQSSAEILEFAWVNDYGVFWIQKSDTGVEQVSNTISVKYGLTVTIQPDGTRAVTTGEPNQGDRFTVINKSKSILNIGLSTRHEQQWKPCFVSQQLVMAGGSIELVPQNKVKLWFQVDIPVTPWSGVIKSDSIELEYLKEEEQKITYKGEGPGTGEWSVLK